jgi:DNA end-binding protein Ku
MARPLWSGSIQISLVGFAVEIYPATNTTKPFAFHEIDRNTLTRVKRQSVSPGAAPGEDAADGLVDTQEAEEQRNGNQALHLARQLQSTLTGGLSAPAAMEHMVDRADIVKGYEYEKGKYAIIEPAELKNLRMAGKKTIEVSQFSRAGEIDPALFEKPYFVMPKAGPQATAFAVIRKSLRESGMVGLGEIVFSGRQHLMALAPPLDPNQPGMMLYTLRFAAELRNARDYSNNVEDVKADDAQLKLAKQLIDAYTQPFEHSAFKDHYEEALRELVEAKINNLPIAEEPVEKKQGKVIDLMEALRKSLLQKKPVQAVDDEAPAETSSSPSGEKKPKTNASSKATTAAAKSQSAASPQAPARKKARSA